MKSVIALIISLLITVTVQAQSFKFDSTGQIVKKTNTIGYKVFKIIDKDTVFVSTKNKYFIFKVSKQSGKRYKAYIKK